MNKAAVILLFLVGCSGIKETWQQQSQNGRFTVVVQETDRGSCCSPSAVISVIDNMTKDEWDAVSAKGGDFPPKLSWIDNQSLVVEICGAQDVTVRSRNYLNPPLNEIGDANEFKIQVITSGHVRIGDKMYCA